MPSSPEVGPDWLKPSAYSILLVGDWFGAGHMTQLRPMNEEMIAGPSGERIHLSPLRVFHSGSDGKRTCLRCRRPGFDHWMGKESSMDRGARQATVRGVTKTLTQISN